MKFDFLLVTSWSEFDTYIQRTIADELEQRGYDTAVLTPTKSTEAIVGSAPTKTFCLESIEADPLSLDTIATAFQIPSIRHLCLTEQAYYDLGYETALKRLQSIASRLDSVFTEHEFRYSYQAKGGELFRLLIHYRMCSNGGYNFWNSFSPFENTVSFSSRLDTSWDAYETKPVSEMNQEELQSTRQLINNFREEQRLYKHETPDLNNESEAISKIKKIPHKIKDVLYTDRPRNITSSVVRTVRKFANSKINQSLVSYMSDSRELCRSNEYVLFPLQFRDESRLTVSSPAFYDQQWVVEYLSRSLPHGVQLFIKQHPNHVGQESPLWIKKLSTKSHVRFLHPDLSSHYAIKHANATVVTNNTVGFEALFYSSPIVVLGQSFYADTPSAKYIGNINTLPEVLGNIVRTDVSEDDRLSSIYSLRNAVYDVPAPDHVEEGMRGKAEALLEFIDDMNY